MSDKLKIVNNKNRNLWKINFSLLVSCVLYLTSYTIQAQQVNSSIDSISVKIGQQITYSIHVETDTSNVVVFPEGQTFLPLEMIESYKIDTTTLGAKHSLLKKYGLTQFDSGNYSIPRQKVIINSKPFYTDSASVLINTITVDTTKQGLYDIKPIIKVTKSSNGLWWKILLGLLALALIGFLLYWFIWRKKPLTEEEKIALLPPYDRAKLALQELDKSNHLQHNETKPFYSKLTFAIRRYLDETVYDHAMESTTDELISRLHILREGNQLFLPPQTIKNIEAILKRADLVKFAKSAPDIELARIDREQIATEIDLVKQALPEPSEEENLLDTEYKEEQKQKSKRRKILITIASVMFIGLLITAGAIVKYGFTTVKDTVFGQDSKELLESDWITSQYGYPPITINTPKVLKRIAIPKQDHVKMSTFAYGSLQGVFSITVNTTQIKDPKQEVNIENAIEGSIKGMETMGASDIVVLKDKFTTPNGAEGIKVYGTLKSPNPLNPESEKLSAQYVMLIFSAKSVLQQVVITYPEKDHYADNIVTKILASIELQQKEKENKTN